MVWILSFIVSVLAGVANYYIGKWGSVLACPSLVKWLAGFPPHCVVIARRSYGYASFFRLMRWKILLRHLTKSGQDSTLDGNHRDN